MAEAMGGRYTVEEVERVHDAWLVEEYRGVFELIEVLNATPGVETACLSNTNERHWSALAGRARSVFPSVKKLAHRFASHLVRSSKPEAAIYQHAERGLAVDGGEIVFFDDLPANVRAAQAQGWRAELVDPDGAPAEQMVGFLHAHRVFS
jgi:HAD superfamily hydrolase (TIGR01509 family)